MHKLQKTFQILMALFILLSAAGPVALPAAGMAQPAHPALAALAAEDPDQLVRVMVQGRGDLAEAAALVERLGGRVVKDLHIINALAAELTAGDAAALARSQSINWVSLDAPVASTAKGSGKGGSGSGSEACTTCFTNTYLDTLGVHQVWDMGYQGENMTVAVVDSGIWKAKDFQIDPTEAKPDTRILLQLKFSDNPGTTSDTTGHGTHVAGIIGGSGYESGGLYVGIAPNVNLLSLSVSDANGMALESDTVDALQWVLDNKDAYNIRVVNLSIQSTVESSYHTSALDAAAEILWFNGIVVVAASGNSGNQSGYNTALAAPANDPFIITVGASDENATSDRSDDTVASFSAYGVTLDGHAKPDIIAPGRDIVSLLGSGSWGNEHPERVVDGDYFRISGTSMAAPMVTGAAVLLLQAEPDLTPDQVKYRLMNAAGQINGETKKSNYPYLDVYAALTTSTTESANTGLQPSLLLQTGGDPFLEGSVNWNSVNWNSVNWNAVNWNSVNWNAVNWNAVNWND